MRGPSKRNVVILLLVCLSLYLFLIVRDNLSFQHQISSTFITFDEFEPEYSRLLKEAQAKGEQPTYNYPIHPSNASIPPKIHFIWFKDLYNQHLDVSTIPHEGSLSPQECRERNPDFEIKIWGAEEAQELLEKEYSWFLPVYNGYRYPIQRVDAFKYFVLLHYGGIYMDLDITCRRSLAPLLPFPAWFPEASPLGVNNDLMATRADHPLMRYMTMMLQERDRNYLFPYLTIFWSTGPSFTSDAIRLWVHKYGQISPAQKNSRDSWRVLPRDFYSEQYTFFGHRPGGTWHGGDVAVVLWFVDHPLIFWGLVIILVAGLFRLSSRRGWFSKRRRG